MTTFTLDTDNNITALAASQQIKESAAETETFSSAQDLTSLAVEVAHGPAAHFWF